MYLNVDAYGVSIRMSSKRVSLLSAWKIHHVVQVNDPGLQEPRPWRRGVGPVPPHGGEWHCARRATASPLCPRFQHARCAQGGMVDDGLRVFDTMGDHGVEKRQVHYACVVDLLGRAGQLSRALGVVSSPCRLKTGKTSGLWGLRGNARRLPAARRHGGRRARG